MEPLLTPEDVTRLFQITIAQVDALVRDGDLVAYRIGGEYRFAPAAIEAFLSAHTTDALSRVQARQGRGRYRAIADLLARQDGDRVTFAFDALNAALAAAGADPLADSAYKHRAWWANTDTHSHATAWMDQGWRVATVDLEARTVTLCSPPPTYGGGRCDDCSCNFGPPNHQGRGCRWQRLPRDQPHDRGARA